MQKMISKNIFPSWWIMQFSEKLWKTQEIKKQIIINKPACLGKKQKTFTYTLEKMLKQDLIPLPWGKKLLG